MQSITVCIYQCLIQRYSDCCKSFQPSWISRIQRDGISLFQLIIILLLYHNYANIECTNCHKKINFFILRKETTINGNFPSYVIHLLANNSAFSNNQTKGTQLNYEVISVMKANVIIIVILSEN